MACSLCHLSYFLHFVHNVVSAQDEFSTLLTFPAFGFLF